ncbi:MAG: hypothetical protein AABZ55_05785 [Bdellovibrionota bacterium]
MNKLSIKTCSFVSLMIMAMTLNHARADHSLAHDGYEFCGKIYDATDANGYRHQSPGSWFGAAACVTANLAVVSWALSLSDAISGTARASNSRNSAGSSASQDRDLKRLLEVVGPEANQYLIDGKLLPGAFQSAVALVQAHDPSISELRIARKVAELNREINAGSEALASEAK